MHIVVAVGVKQRAFMNIKVTVITVITSSIIFLNHGLNFKIGDVEISANLQQIAIEAALIMIKKEHINIDKNKTIILPSTFDHRAVDFFFNGLLKNYHVICVGGCLLSNESAIYNKFDEYFFPQRQKSEKNTVRKLHNLPVVTLDSFAMALPKITEVMKLFNSFNINSKYALHLYELFYHYLHHITDKGERIIDIIPHFQPAIVYQDTEKITLFCNFFEQFEKCTKTFYTKVDSHNLLPLTWKLEDSSTVAQFPGKSIIDKEFKVYKQFKSEIKLQVKSKFKKIKNYVEEGIMIKPPRMAPMATTSLAPMHLSLNTLD